jgi:hypothetical protein
MAAAWEVVERFVADGFSVEVLTHSDLVRPVSVAIYEPRGRLRRQGRAHELTAPLAICLAALKALAATSQPASPPEPTGLFSPMLEPTE